MSVFIGIHQMPGPVDESEIQKGWASYKEACAKRGLKAIRVGYNAQKGRAHCLTEAPTENDVREAHSDINLLPQEIIEVKILE